MRVVLKVLEKGLQFLITDKFADLLMAAEPDESLGATLIGIIGRSLGETLDEIFYPTQWEKFLKRKDCPKYMKKLTKVNINAYYPKLSLPKEKNYITIDKLGSMTAEDWLDLGKM